VSESYTHAPKAIDHRTADEVSGAADDDNVNVRPKMVAKERNTTLKTSTPSSRAEKDGASSNRNRADAEDAGAGRPDTFAEKTADKA
jgi:hypothetical protein